MDDLDFSHVDSHFWAWLAGFADGEGNFGITRKVKRPGQGGRHVNECVTYNPYLAVSQTDRAPLDEIVAELGIGQVHNQPRTKYNANSRDGWQYIVSGRAAVIIAGHLMPYLRVKQVQAEVLTRYPFTQRGAVYRHGSTFREQEALFIEIRSLNKRGNGLPTRKAGKPRKVNPAPLLDGLT